MAYAKNEKELLSTPDDSASDMRAEIETKWGKFDAEEIAALKSNDDLVAQLVSKYGLDAAEALSEVKAFAKDRRL